MSRTISLTARQANNAEESGEVWVFLVTVTHDLLETPIRLSSDPTVRLSEEPLAYGTVSRGNTFEFLPMSLVLPDDSDGTVPAFKFAFDDVTHEAVPLLRSVSTPPTVTVEMVLASAPDDVEISYADFDLIDAQYDALQVTTDVTIDALSNEPYPAGSFTPGGFGGLF